MARRGQRKGDYLMSDDYFGQTHYASELTRDFWGSWAVKPLERNLQEIAQPLEDPQPVPFYNGPTYEFTPACIGETAPLHVGLTTVSTNPYGVGVQALDLFPSLGEMAVGCNFLVY